MAPTCVSVKDCRELLQNNNNNANLLNFSLQPFSDKLRGYAGEHFLLKLEVEEIVENGTERKTLTYFVKSLQNSGDGEIFSEHKLFEKELFVYKFFDDVSRILPSARLLPKLVHFTADKSLVLENLEESGFKGYEPMVYDRQHMLVLLEALAKFHSVTFAYEAHKARELGRKYELAEDFGEFFETIFSNRTETNGYKFVQSCKIGAHALIDMICGPNEENARFKAKIDKYVPEFLALLNTTNEFAKVITHGDIWAYNALFKYENGAPIDCKLIDFQLIRYAPPAHDVTLAVYFCGASQMNRTQEYYEHYYNSLARELTALDMDIQAVLPRKEYEETCKLYLPCAKFIWFCYRQTSQAPAEYMLEQTKDLAVWESIVLGENRIGFIKHNYENFDFYRDNLRSVLRDNVINDYITMEDCYDILAQEFGDTDYRLLDCAFNKLDKYGFLAEHYKLALKVEFRNEIINLSYFVKVEPEAEQYKKFASHTKCDYKEVQFYKRLVRDFKNRGINLISDCTPKYYVSSMDAIVLEDLKSSGYITLSAREAIPPETLQQGLTCLAKFHASGVIYEEQQGRKLNEMYPDEFIESLYSTNEMSENLLSAGKKGLKQAIQILSHHTSIITPEEFTTRAHKIIDRYGELSAPSTEFRNTINHGDLWSGNIMFGPKRAVLVDFQCDRYAPPARDLMHFLYFTTDKATRSKHLDKLKRYYYEQFKANIEAHDINVDDVLGYEEFLRSCECEKRLAVAQVCTHFQNILIDPEKMNEFFGDVEFCEKSLFGDRSELVRKLTASDTVYVHRLGEAIAELRLICEEDARNNKD